MNIKYCDNCGKVISGAAYRIHEKDKSYTFCNPKCMKKVTGVTHNQFAKRTRLPGGNCSVY